MRFTTAIRTESSSHQRTTSGDKRPLAPQDAAGTPQAMSPLAIRVHGEYEEMPGLRLTVGQAARLFNVAPGVADAALHELRRASILARSNDGAFALIGEPCRERPVLASGATINRNDMSTQVDAITSVNGSLKDASLDRLTCLLRHWAWAEEARTTFDRELVGGWDYNDDPLFDHPFGSYYHWCALLCGFSEAALEHGLLAPFQLDAIRRDLEVSLPGLRACRRLLVVIPTSLEDHPRILDLFRDDETLGRLRRIHASFGDALREERLLREIDSLDH